VEKIVEVVVEKEVVKEVVVEKTVEVVVTATPTPTPLPTVTPMPISTVSSRPAATPTPAPNASATPTVAPVQTAGEIYQIWQGSEDTVAAIAALVSTGDYSDVEARETLNDWIRTATQESTGATDWAAIAAGAFYTVALKSDGTLWGWGENSSGQLGIGTTVPKDVPSQEVTGAINWSAISAGDFHTVALKSDGTLWAWGWNYYGQLGDGTTTRKNTPTQIGTDTNWRSISAGDSHTAALKTDNTLWTWGYNALGQLGDGTILSKSTPVQESTVENNWRSISAGDSHTVALKLDNTLWTWGYNAYGQLGDGTTLGKSIPAQESTGGNNWSAISTGTNHTVALKSDGTLWAWGSNYHGQVGDGTNVDNKIRPTQEASAVSNWSAISAGTNHTVALKSDGTLWAWGSNELGMLGDGTTATNRIVPTQEVTGADTWTTIATGEKHTVALKSNGTLRTWGSD
jgi:alpha-tubulin suppressor-like RCC1 family protein